MIIEIKPETLEDFTIAWLREHLSVLQKDIDSFEFLPEDEELYKKDIEAIKHLLEYLTGEK